MLFENKHLQIIYNKPVRRLCQHGLCHVFCVLKKNLNFWPISLIYQSHYNKEESPFKTLQFYFTCDVVKSILMTHVYALDEVRNFETYPTENYFLKLNCHAQRTGIIFRFDRLQLEHIQAYVSYGEINLYAYQGSTEQIVSALMNSGTLCLMS